MFFMGQHVIKRIALHLQILEVHQPPVLPWPVPIPLLHQEGIQCDIKDVTIIIIVCEEVFFPY